MNGELKVGLLYIALHNQLERKFGRNKVVSRKEIFAKIGRFQHIPRGIIPIVIKDMEERGLIEKISRDTIKILPCIIDLERDSTKLYELAGLLDDSNTKSVTSKK